MRKVVVQTIMNIFLVRHGETVQNRTRIHQLPTTPLSSVGIQQAISVAEALGGSGIDVIFSSPLRRAMETARIVSKITGKHVMMREALKEIRKPSIIIGKSHEHPDAKIAKEKIRENYQDRNWHYSDEENFFDLRNRVEQVIGMLTRESHSNILVISHSIVIKMLVALTVFGQKFNALQFYDFYTHSCLYNGSITHCQYSEDSWKLVYFNKATTSQMN